MIVKKNKWKKDRMRYKQIKKKNSVTAQNMIIKKKKTQSSVVDSTTAASRSKLNKQCVHVESNIFKSNFNGRWEK